MRDFSDADRNRKRNRIQLPDNPGNLSAEKLTLLEKAVMAGIKEGYLSCPAAWKIARESDVSRLDVGVMIDNLGIRVIDCQIGCFKVSKTPGSRVDMEYSEPQAEAVQRIKALDEAGELTCKAMHDLSAELDIKPLALAGLANMTGCRIRNCQLGCF